MINKLAWQRSGFDNIQFMKDVLTALLGLPVPTRKRSTDTEWTDDCDADEMGEDADDEDAAPNEGENATIHDGEKNCRSCPDLRRMVACELPASASVEILEEQGVAPVPDSSWPMSVDPANADTLVYEYIGGDTQEPGSVSS